MAINKIVFYSPDRHLRISASGTRAREYIVERDLVLVAKLSSMDRLESWLRENGLSLGELIED